MSAGAGMFLLDQTEIIPTVASRPVASFIGQDPLRVGSRTRCDRSSSPSGQVDGQVAEVLADGQDWQPVAPGHGRDQRIGQRHGDALAAQGLHGQASREPVGFQQRHVLDMGEQQFQRERLAIPPCMPAIGA